MKSLVNIAKIFFLLLAVMFIQSCAYETKIPVDTLVYKSDTPVTNNNSRLIILLRGFGNDINYFDIQGWTDLLQDKYPQYTLVIPDMHFGYYQNDTFAQRLKEDVIKPAKAQGFQSIWIIGISMGGLGAIMTSQAYPDDIERLYLYAPYIGDGTITRQIELAGGLANWRPDFTDNDKWQYKLWKRVKFITESNKGHVPVFLGYGTDDEMVGLPLLAAALPKKQVIITNGGHRDWVFTALFQEMLERKFFE